MKPGMHERPPTAHPHPRSFIAKATIPPMRKADLAFQDFPLTVIVSLITAFRPWPGVLDAEGVGDPLVRGVSLLVGAVGVDSAGPGLRAQVRRAISRSYRTRLYLATGLVMPLTASTAVSAEDMLS